VGRDDMQRDVLPIPDIPPAGLTTYDAKDPDTAYPPIEPLRPPTGERLAAQGLKYNRFHTTALCSPTRSALLTGRNHHSVGMGNIAELATSCPRQQLDLAEQRGADRQGPQPVGLDDHNHMIAPEDRVNLAMGLL
jgi:arylsulfatase A-like enzyme